MQLGKNVLLVWKHFVLKRKQLRKLCLMHKSEHSLNKIDIRNGFVQWKSHTNVNKHKCAARLRSSLEHFKRKMLSLGWKNWMKHDLTLKRNVHSVIWMERHLDIAERKLMINTFQKMKDGVRRQRTIKKVMLSYCIKFKKTSIQLFFQQWVSNIQQIKRKEKKLTFIISKMQKYLFRNGFTIWKTVVHMHAKVDLLYLKKRKHRMKLRFNQWYTWSALRKQAKRTIVIAMQRHLKSMNQYYLHQSWRKWWQQIHGGCLRILSTEHETEIKRQIENHASSIEYIHQKHDTVTATHEASLLSFNQKHDTLAATYEALQLSFNQQILEFESKIKNYRETTQSKHEDIVQQQVIDFNQRIQSKDIQIEQNNSILQEQIQSTKIDIEKIEQIHYYEIQKLQTTLLDDSKTASATFQEEQQKYATEKRIHEETIHTLNIQMELLTKSLNVSKKEISNQSIQLLTLQKEMQTNQQEYTSSNAQLYLEQTILQQSMQEQETNFNTQLNHNEKKDQQLITNTMNENEKKINIIKNKHTIDIQNQAKQHQTEIEMLKKQQENVKSELKISKNDNEKNINVVQQKYTTDIENQLKQHQTEIERLTQLHVNEQENILNKLKISEMKTNQHMKEVFEKQKQQEQQYKNEMKQQIIISQQKQIEFKKEFDEKEKKLVSKSIVALSKWKYIYGFNKIQIRKQKCTLKAFHVWKSQIMNTSKFHNVLKHSLKLYYVRTIKLYVRRWQQQTKRDVQVDQWLYALSSIIRNNLQRRLFKCMYQWKQWNHSMRTKQHVLLKLVQHYNIERVQKLYFHKWNTMNQSITIFNQKRQLSLTSVLLHQYVSIQSKNQLLHSLHQWKKQTNRQQTKLMQQQQGLHRLAVVWYRDKRKYRNQYFMKWKLLVVISKQADDFEDELTLQLQKHTDQFPWSMWTRVSSSLNLLLPSCNPVSGCAFAGKVILENKENDEQDTNTKSGTQRLNRMSRRNQMNRSSERKHSYSSTFSSTFSSTSVSSMSVLTNNEADDAAGIVDVRSKKYGADFTAIDEHCTCYTCQRYTKSYLHHLFRSSRVTCQHLIALHNMHYTCRVIARLCGEDESLAEKVRRMFPLVEPDLSSRVLHPSFDGGDGGDDFEDWQYPLVTPESTPGGVARNR